MSETYPEACTECGADGWTQEMGEFQLLWHKRTCSRWHWYCDGGPEDVPKPFDYPFNSREEAANAAKAEADPLTKRNTR